MVAVASLLASILIYAKTAREQRRFFANQANYDTMNAGLQLLHHYPDALRLHGVTDDDLRKLKQAGVNAEDAMYLMLSFDAGARYYLLADERDPAPFEPGNYRYHMFAVPATREAWKVLRNAMADCLFKQKADATVAAFEHQNPPS